MVGLTGRSGETGTVWTGKQFDVRRRSRNPEVGPVNRWSGCSTQVPKEQWSTLFVRKTEREESRTRTTSRSKGRTESQSHALLSPTKSPHSFRPTTPFPTVLHRPLYRVPLDGTRIYPPLVPTLPTVGPWRGPQGRTSVARGLPSSVGVGVGGRRPCVGRRRVVRLVVRATQVGRGRVSDPVRDAGSFSPLLPGRVEGVDRNHGSCGERRDSYFLRAPAGTTQRPQPHQYPVRH